MNTGTESKARSERMTRTPLDFAAIFCGLLLIVILSGVIGWQFWHANRIYSGVSVAGVPVGGLTRGMALESLDSSLPTYPQPPVSIQHGGRIWPLPTDQIMVEANFIDAVNRAYLVGRQGTFSLRLAQQFTTALRGLNIVPTLDYNVGHMRQAVSEVAAQVRQPARTAVRVGDATLPAEAGLDVDTEATLAGILAMLQENETGEPINIALAVSALAAPEAEAGAEYELGDPVATPLILSDSRYGLDLALDARELDRILLTTDPPTIDRDALREYLTMWGEQIAVPVRDARLNFNPATGGVTVLQPSQSGRELDVEATIAAAEGALASGLRRAELVMTDLTPAVDMNRVAEMGIRELVASGSTYFAGSSAARIRNIEVAAEKFDGVVIPPGEIFSFNNIVEDVSAANGFEDSLIIWGDRTAVGVGGGVCQVSTTVFRAAYQAGFPVVERYNHGYVVDWYGEPGLDATIYTPTVDFRFRNDTDAYLLIDPVVDSGAGVITFNLYGTKPDRQVIISDPVTTEVLEPGKPTYLIDGELASGQRQQVEWPKKGMTVAVERTIIDNDTTRTDTIVSQYQPWRAVYLVGSAGDVPAGADVGTQ